MIGASRFWALRAWAARYWPKIGAASVPPEPIVYPFSAYIRSGLSAPATATVALTADAYVRATFEGIAPARLALTRDADVLVTARADAFERDEFDDDVEI